MSNGSKFGEFDGYVTGYWITWLLIFIGTWIYCIATYGFLLGVGLGWLAAGITAFVLAIFWPLYVVALALGLLALLLVP